MNSLEFIDEKINWTISMIKYHEERLLKFKGKNKERNFFYIFECQCVNHYKEDLEKYQQIKIELEAWEVIKDEIEVKEVPNYFYPKYYIFLIYKNGEISKEKYETIKKALEVNE